MVIKNFPKNLIRLNTFCTIVTSSHLSLAKALYHSLQKFNPDIRLNVLITDDNKMLSTGNLNYFSIQELTNQLHFKEIEKKYAHTNADHFRWALKPVFMSYLLQNGFSKVIFSDPDLYFVSDYRFLFDELETSNVIVTPHWANLNPLENPDSLFSVLRGGLYNAGFIGTNIKGLPAIQWWSELCHYRMEKRQELGLYDDQKYLDLLPVQFQEVKIIKHPGCNLAAWNIETCKRERINGNVMINKTYEPVFIHFTKDTVINILNKNDALLQPYLTDYIRVLESENFDLLNRLDSLDTEKFRSIFYSVKHKLRLRTRFKKFLFLLAEKL